MIPPWQKYPEIPRFSIGWRMGGGEDYFRQFRTWYKSLTDQEADEYARQNPEFEEWQGFYAAVRRGVPPSEEAKKIAAEKIRAMAERRRAEHEEQ
jgi:hypothetical protein